MIPPWHELKQAEVVAIDVRTTGLRSLTSDVIEPLRNLLNDCKTATDANDAICFHGALSLILEFDGELDSAIKHRKIEISKIRELHDLARINPGDRPALVNYERHELQRRTEILDELLNKNTR